MDSLHKPWQLVKDQLVRVLYIPCIVFYKYEIV